MTFPSHRHVNRLLAVVLILLMVTVLSATAASAAPAAGPPGTSAGYVSINDSAATGTVAVSYSTGWAVSTGAAKFQRDDHYGWATGATATVVFNGTGAKIYGARGPQLGIVKFDTDGGGAINADLYARARSDQQLLFAVDGLSAGRHIITMRITGAKNKASAGTSTSLDRIDVANPAAIAGPFVTRSGSTLLLGDRPFRFAGANMYWLGLDDNITDVNGPTYPTQFRIDNALQGAAANGLTVVRSHTLGISVGCSRCVEPSLGVFNESAFQAADYAIYRAGSLGLKLMIPLVDQWRFYHGGISTFTSWRGYTNDATPGSNAANSHLQRDAEAHFYTDSTVSDDYKRYLTYVLDHVNPYTKLAYKDDPTVMAWETGNEVWTAPPTWTQDIAWFLKHKVGARQLVADGSAASGMHVSQAAITAPDVDILGGHFYPVDTAWLVQDAATAAAAGKAYIVGEFDWTNADATKALITEVQGNRQISGAIVWTLMPYQEDGTPEPHDDGFALYSPATTPAMASILSLLKAHAAVMSREPSVR